MKRLMSIALILGALAACSSADDGGENTAQTATPTALHVFDPAAGELPEGIAVSGSTAYVGLAPTGSIVRVDLAAGAVVTPFGSLPKPPANGFMTGLALGPDARLYAALVSPDASVQGGIYRLPAAGGDAELFSSHAELGFPNGIVFDADGSLLVTESGGGKVFRIASDGTASVWISDPTLVGQRDFCGPDLNTFDIGANGIALGDGAVYVANNDKGSIIQIPVRDDGTAGTPKLLVEPDCDTLGGADGLARAEDGSLWVAVNRQNRLVRVDPAGKLTTVAEGGVLDFPASLAFGSVGGEPSLLITSFALGAALSGGQPNPALVALPAE